MDKKYIELFKGLAQATAVSAEQVMDYDKEKGDEKGFDTAKMMRDDYQELQDRIEELQDSYELNKNDVAKLLVAAAIQTNQLQDRINNLKKAMVGYQSEVMPKLQEILDNAKSDEEVVQMANEKFIIENNN